MSRLKRVYSNEVEEVAESLSLDEAFDRFYLSKQAENLRPRTLDDHKTHFKFLKTYLETHQPQVVTINDLGSEVIYAYTTHMLNDHEQFPSHPGRQEKNKPKGLAPGTVNIRLRTLRCFLNFLHKESLIANNLSHTIKLQRVSEEVPALEEKELLKLLAQPDQKAYAGFRDYVLMYLLANTGLRIKEALSLKRSDMDLSQGLLIVTSDVSKTHRARTVPLSKKVVRLLRELQREVDHHFPDQEHVFISSLNQPISRSQVNHRMKQYAEMAEITDKQVSPHVLRHTFATLFILKGGDPFILQRILGHTTAQMTSKYVTPQTADLQRAFKDFSPLS